MFYDGVCGFCNFWVDFLLRRDPQGRLLFAPLQGATARRLLNPNDIEHLHSLIFWTPECAYRQSAAVVRILWTLGGVWRLIAGLLWLIPIPLRNVGYRLVARHRYRLFGKKETCRMPSPQERARFLD